VEGGMLGKDGCSNASLGLQQFCRSIHGGSDCNRVEVHQIIVNTGHKNGNLHCPGNNFFSTGAC